jgi:uncharacterized protein (UPF0335 family)
MTDVNKLKGYVQELVTGLQKRADANSFMKDVLETAKEDGMKPKQLRQLAKLAYERNKEEVEAEIDELLSLYDSLELN